MKDFAKSCLRIIQLLLNFEEIHFNSFLKNVIIRVRVLFTKEIYCVILSGGEVDYN